MDQELQKDAASAGDTRRVLEAQAPGRLDRSGLFYHYTDFQALDGILRCAQLRVNNVLRMNDSAEMRHFMVRLSSAIVKRLKEGGERPRGGGAVPGGAGE